MQHFFICDVIFLKLFSVYQYVLYYILIALSHEASPPRQGGNQVGEEKSCSTRAMAFSTW
jgi:hypothetical protein